MIQLRIDELARTDEALLAEIRDHRRADTELREAKERLTLALDGSRLALWGLDVASESLYLSEQWAAMDPEPWQGDGARGRGLRIAHDRHQCRLESVDVD